MRTARPLRSPRAPNRLAPRWQRVERVLGWGAAHRETAGPAAHQAAILFVAAGAIGFVSDGIPFWVGHGHPIALVLDALNVAIGLTAARLPWLRWRDRATLILAVIALASLAASGMAGVLPGNDLGVWFILVFVWIGMCHAPGTPLLMAPFAIAAYLVPIATGGVDIDGGAATVVVSIPVAVLVGETIARQAAGTRRAQAGQREALDALARANVTDDLTGLGNRRRANALLDELADDDALVILDIDHFKRVNDTLGHHRGDEVLQQLGAFLRATTREGDSVARYGGEEFVMVVRDAGTDALAIAERLLAAWRASDPPVTLSAGVAVQHAGVGWSTTFSNADAALYRAKSTGRDRAVLHGAMESAPSPDRSLTGAQRPAVDALPGPGHVAAR
jgi:diguanylate cyclase (GGDEF)-like protein